MNKSSKLFAVLLLAVCFAFLGTTVGVAAVKPEPIAPMYELTFKITASCSVSSGTASCYGYVRASASTSDVSLTVTLYKQEGESWDSVSSWRLDNQGQYGEIDASYKVGSGVYKVVVVGTVVDLNGNTETVTRTSSIVKNN
ncbi:MAG: hypothetical protein IJX67_03505 [Oscillospiraceae bacterium]|nr:hypothetical protein [Clostridia bacterium]MBQ9167461.1 hypothetical protein [Oscillospiraceae bacterium]